MMKVFASVAVSFLVTGIGIFLSGSSVSTTGDLAVSGLADTTKKEKTTAWPESFGFGHPASALQIAPLDIDVRPDGVGLPAGSGNATIGKVIYLQKCAACHGETGEVVPGVKLPGPPLVSDTAFVTRKTNTIGNYWPYASTVFDYIRRAMPYNSAGSLTNNEVYALTAYLLNANKIITKEHVLNAQTLPKIVMPAQKYFINDDRKGGAEVK